MDKQKDFEKGWEEYKAKQKKEIKEMIGIIQNAVGCEERWAKWIAEELHKNHYRKIPENAVVLTKKELAEIQLKYYRQGVVGATSRFSEQVYDLIPLTKEFGTINRGIIDEICKTVVKLEEIEYD